MQLQTEITKNTNELKGDQNNDNSNYHSSSSFGSHSRRDLAQDGKKDEKPSDGSVIERNKRTKQEGSKNKNKKKTKDNKGVKK